MIFLPSAKFLYRPQLSVAPWTPLSLGNTVLYGWYKADAGLSVSTDGASVATWADQSTNNNNLAQANTANRGVFRTAANGVNGIPVLEFASSSVTPKFVEDTAFLGSDSDGWSFYIVSRNLPARTQYGGAFVIGPRSDAGSINQFCDNPAGTVNLRNHYGATDWGNSAYTSNYAVAKVSCAASYDSVKYQTTYTPAIVQPTAGNIALGAGFSLGTNYFGSVGSQIAEVILCKRELTTGYGSEEASLDAYFRSRYGLGLYYGADLPVTGAALWLDASRSDSLFVENTFATAVTTDNGPVGGWKDLSGNNRHALQSGTNRPTWRTPINGQNGLGVMSFNGSTQWLDVANLPSLASGYTFYGVLKQPAASGIPFCTADAGTAGSNAHLYSDTSTSAFSLSQWGLRVAGPATSSMPLGFIANYDGAHPTGVFMVRTSQGTSNVTGSLTQNVGTPAAGTARLGRATNTQTYWFNSQIYELVVLPRQSNSTEDQAWKTYTAAKWGITWTP